MYDYQTETTAIRSRKACALTEELFDREEEKSAHILFSVLETRSPRKSDWSLCLFRQLRGRQLPHHQRRFAHARRPLLQPIQNLSLYLAVVGL
jgi:hypothetical protein